jgi:hypothetical protein
MEGASSSGTPQQGASSCSKPMEKGVIKLVTFKAGRHHLEKTRLSGSTRRKRKSWKETRLHVPEVYCKRDVRQHLSRWGRVTPAVRMKVNCQGASSSGMPSQEASSCSELT